MRPIVNKSREEQSNKSHVKENPPSSSSSDVSSISSGMSNENSSLLNPLINMESFKQFIDSKNTVGLKMAMDNAKKQAKERTIEAERKIQSVGDVLKKQVDENEALKLRYYGFEIENMQLSAENAQLRERNLELERELADINSDQRREVMEMIDASPIDDDLVAPPSVHKLVEKFNSKATAKRHHRRSQSFGAIEGRTSGMKAESDESYDGPPIIRKRDTGDLKPKGILKKPKFN